MRVPKISVLGGGPGGLATGYFAKKHGLSFHIFEAQPHVGGNAITFEADGFRFDSGAHRFHDKDPVVTAEILALLGPSIRKIEVPSQIYHQGQWIDFPLSPQNLFQALGVRAFTKALASWARAQVTTRTHEGSFEAFAVRTYGRDIAERFLLHYSEKLWGRPSRVLSPSISGKRLKGLSIRTLLYEFFLGKAAKTQHLDGKFYYPDQGFGEIAKALASYCGDAYISTQARITRVNHTSNRIEALQINNDMWVDVDTVVSTLPLPLLLHLLDPPLSSDIRNLTRRLAFRNVILVVFLLDKPSITSNGSVYFPDPDMPLTRVYEPRNRSPHMAPPGKTSLVAEVPCDPTGPLWNMDKDELVTLIQGALAPTDWFKPDEVLATVVKRMPKAYPILELGHDDIVAQLQAALRPFENLHITGRNGLFAYTHVHDMLRFGKDVVETIAEQQATDSLLTPVDQS